MDDAANPGGGGTGHAGGGRSGHDDIAAGGGGSSVGSANAQTHYPGVSPFASYQYHKKRLIVVSDFTTLPDLAGNEAADEGGNVR